MHGRVKRWLKKGYKPALLSEISALTVQVCATVCIVVKLWKKAIKPKKIVIDCT